MKTIEILVSGKVQGVFYRATANEVARSLGITGRVKNLRDGRVWIIASGNEEQLQQLKDWAKQGPPAARVEDLEIKEVEVADFKDFRTER